MSNHKYVSNGDHEANPSSQEMQLAGSPQAMRLTRTITIFLVARRCLLISLKLWGHSALQLAFAYGCGWDRA
jgi:hypothetical protein